MPTAHNAATLYPEDFESRIGFSAIRTSIAKLANSSMGAKGVMESRFSCDTNLLAHTLTCLDEFKQLLLLDSNFPTDGYRNPREEIAHLGNPQFSFSLAGLADLHKMLEATLRIQDFIESRQQYPTLRALVLAHPSPRALCLRLRAVLSPEGEMLDNASPALQSIRSELRAQDGRIETQLNSLLTQGQRNGSIAPDAQISVRNGKRLLPILAQHKREVHALLIDTSATGQTLFVQPYEVLAIENNIRSLQAQELEEIKRILLQVTEALRPSRESLLAYVDTLAQIDTLYAKAKFAARVGGGKPILCQEPHLYLREAQHPQLLLKLKAQGRQPVPLSLELTQDQRIMVISGPNAGGKSLCLKTVAMAIYMLQCGFLPLVKENSEMGLFQHLFLNIGDEQSIENDLSTYSSHLQAMRLLAKQADESTFFLIDELGSGTEPLAGGAIAQALLEAIIPTKAFGIVTTHYSNIKTLATTHHALVNGAMHFDQQTMAPTYQLEVGAPGSSYAFAMAKRMGLPNSIVDRASQIAGEDYIALEKQLQQAARDRRYWMHMREKIRLENKHNEALKNKLELANSNLQAKQQQLLLQAQKEAQRIIAESNKAIEATIRTIKESQADRESTRQARAALEEKKLSLEKALALQAAQLGQSANPTEEQNITTGCKVKLRGSESVGEVITLNGSSAVIGIGQMMTTVSLDKLELLSEKQYRRAAKRPQMPSAARSTALRKLNFRAEIDIRGYRGEPAISAVQQLIDNACMLGMHKVWVLHGRGNGTLRQLIHNYLRSLPYVDAFQDAPEDQGGSGITVITLKH